VRVIDKLTLRLRSLFRRKKVDAELEDELRFHLDQLVNEMVSAGVPPNQVRQAALRSMGSLAQFQEECRDMRRVNLWEDFLRDMGYAWRSWTRTPFFSLSVILILAIGIGVNCAVFTIVRSVVLNPLPYPNANQLVALWKTDKTDSARRSGVAPADFFDLQQQSRTCAAVAAFSNTFFDVTGVVEPYRVIARRISSNLFATLGVRPAVGRDFTPADDQPSAARIAILSSSLWHNRFQGRPDIVGVNITLNNEQYAIVGVMPDSFMFPEIDGPGMTPELWTTLRFTDQRTERGSGYMRIVARLKAGLAPQAARAEFEGLSRQFLESQPRAYGGKLLTVIPLQENIVGDVRKLLLVLLGAVTCVLLITCTNVANMLLVRATVRIKELAVRSSLGASHWRLTRQLLTEHLGLGLCGGALGLGLVLSLIRALPSMEFADLPRAHEISIDGWIIAFNFGISTLTGLFFGVLPAWRISRIDPQRSLQEASRVTSGRQANGLRVLFGVAQVSLALMLVTAAGLLLRSFVSLRKADLGFQPGNVLTFQLPLPNDLREPKRRTAFYREVAERIGRLPNVRNIGMINYLPLAGNVFGWGILIQGRETPVGAPSPQAEYRVVSGDLFSSLSIPIKAGREFDEQDRADALPVGIINETMARRYWPGENPIGRKFRLGGPPSMFPWVTIVGVASDVRYGDLEAAPEPTIYQPLAQTSGPSLSVVVRSNGNPMNLMTSIRGQIREVDRSVPLLNVREFDYFISKSLARRRLVLVVLSTFGLIALFLAAFGIYSVISNSVTQRTQEIGLRVALGAGEVGVLKLVLKQAMWISMVGISAGLAGTLTLGNVVESLLYNVAPTDPLTIGAVAILLVLVTVVACYFPARRALRVDPLVALRHE
jgi:putative ABC transport system permease protein